MKVSTAALPFFILAATLGPLALGLPAHGDLGGGSLSLKHELNLVPDHSFMDQGGVHHPTDCCFSYTPRNIRCLFMENYYTTSSACTQPAVIFTTKRGREVCVRPTADGVQECMEQLVFKNTVEKQLVEEKLQ